MPKILSVSPLNTKEHPYKEKKNLQGSFFKINEKVDFLLYKTVVSQIGLVSVHMFLWVEQCSI